MKLSWALLSPLVMSMKECPRLWHIDEVSGKCRPGIEHVRLKCSGELIEVEFNDIVFGDSLAITVNK